jgi:bis(5'-nucleosyl)-tetraphosphatase (symmetrical)
VSFTYVIGDLQGCFDSLQALLSRIGYRSGRDRLILAGDLVNRGPKSLETLRWAAREPALRCVLGNHDLHLLCVSVGVAKSRRRDTFASICGAADADELLSWLRAQPLFLSEDDYAVVHAGIHPEWSLSKTAELAEEVERELRGPAVRAAARRVAQQRARGRLGRIVAGRFAARGALVHRAQRVY